MRPKGFEATNYSRAGERQRIQRRSIRKRDPPEPNNLAPRSGDLHFYAIWPGGPPTRAFFLKKPTTYQETGQGEGVIVYVVDSGFEYKHVVSFEPPGAGATLGIPES